MQLLPGNLFIKILLSLWTFKMLLKVMFNCLKEFQTINKNSNGCFEVSPLVSHYSAEVKKKKESHIQKILESVFSLELSLYRVYYMKART